MRYATIGLACGVACWGLFAATAHAGEIATGNLVITQAWSRATPGGAQVAGGYLSIENKGSLPDRLLSASTSTARKVEIHEMAVDKGIMTMRPTSVTPSSHLTPPCWTPTRIELPWALHCNIAFEV